MNDPLKNFLLELSGVARNFSRRGFSNLLDGKILGGGGFSGFFPQILAN